MKVFNCKTDEIKIFRDACLQIDRRTLKLALSLLMFIEFVFVTTGYMKVVWCVINALIILLWTVKYSRLMICNLSQKFFWLILGYESIIVFSSIMNRTLTWGILYATVAAFVVVNVLYIERDIVFDALYVLYSFVSIINFLSIVFFAEQLKMIDMRYCSLLGGKNGLAKILIPGILIFAIKLQETSKKIIPAVLCIITLVQLVLSESSTAIIVAFVGIFLYVLFRKHFPYRIIFFSCMIIELFLLSFSTFGQKYVVQFVQLFHKEITFSSRTLIWQEAERMISRHWLLGYGRGLTPICTCDGNFTETHNLFLQVLFNGGIIAFGIYIMLFVVIIRMNKKVYDINANIMMIGIVMVFVGGLMESIQDALGIWITLGICYTYARMNYEESGLIDYNNDTRI